MFSYIVNTNGSVTIEHKIISDIFVNLNLPVKKAEKEIGIYKASIKKMAQAKELLEELKIKNKKQNK